MKKMLLVLALLVFLGCEAAEKASKHIKSSVVGLNRRVTLYDCGGNVIKQWEGRFMIEPFGSGISFIHNGHEVKVVGIIVVEETK